MLVHVLQKNMKAKDMGQLVLRPSSGKMTEVCFELVSSSSPGTPVFENLSNIRFTLARGVKAWSGETSGVEQEKGEQDPSDKKEPSHKAAVAGAAAKKPAGSKGSGAKGKVSRTGLQPVYDREWVSQDSVLDTWEDLQSERRIHKNLEQTAGMQRVEKDAYRTAALKVAADKAKESMFVGQKTSEQQQQAQWDKLREQYLWPEGQGEVLESMFSPYDSEGINTCVQCQPEL